MNVVGQLTLAEPKGPTYTLDNLENHALHVRSNTLGINAGLRKVLVLLRGEEHTGQAIGEPTPVSGKLAELSVILHDARGNQDETFQLIAELQSLLNVDA